MGQRPPATNVIVLGMHRSGTSMVSGFLEKHGLFTGERDEILVPQDDNPSGFFERQDVVSLNDAILETAGGSWFSPPLQHTDIEQGLVSQASEIIERLGDGPWLLKDPRLLATWEHWQEALGEVVLVYVYRSPVAVAASLQARNGFPPDLGLALWEYYNRRALQLLSGRPFVAISYENFRADPVTAGLQLLDGLHSQGIALHAGDESEASPFDPALDHSSQLENSIELLLTDPQRQLARQCEETVNGSLPPAVPGLDAAAALRLAGLSQAFHDLSNARQTAKELDFTAKQLQSVERLFESERDRLEGELRRHESELEQERQQLYLTLTGFDRSLPGRLVAATIRFYLLVTLRPRGKTAYQDLMATAREYLLQHPPEPGSQTVAPPSRAAMLISVLAYMARNPAGSLRSFSLPRLKRALSIFSGADREDLAQWVEQRFPSSSELATSLPTLEELQKYDTLELQLPVTEAPRVSIVIPAYNQYRMTVNCLKSLLESEPGVPYEVILADDGSTDLTTSIEDRISGLRLFRPEQNQGFVRNCNSAAALARGEYLLLLNNDTALHGRWLDELVEVLDQDVEAGIVGPKLLFGNGRLQEAGGIVWNDASGWNFGRADDPGKPEYNYRKSTDYISGACLLVRRALWEQLGGFDERYVPAYYEDTDLCFAARAAGYKVIYQPHSQVIHYEGMTNGTDLDSGIKKYQVDNQARFREKWAEVLEREHYPNGSEVFRARDRSRGRRTVLVIDHYVPSFDKDAGSRSTWMYLKLFASMGYKVMFMGANFFPHQPYTGALQSEGIEVLVGESIARRLSTWLQNHAAEIDTVYIHRPHVAEQFIDKLQKYLPDSKLVYFGHDLHYLRFRREQEVTGENSTAQDAEDWHFREHRLFEKMHQIYYPSQAEVDIIHREKPGLPVRAIPLYVLEDAALPNYHAAAREGILFVGGFGHPPNVDAICWFAEQVMPLVWERFPNMTLHVVGSNATVEVQRLASPRVLVHGYLSDEALEHL